MGVDVNGEGLKGNDCGGECDVLWKCGVVSWLFGGGGDGGDGGGEVSMSLYNVLQKICVLAMG